MSRVCVESVACKLEGLGEDYHNLESLQVASVLVASGYCVCELRMPKPTVRMPTSRLDIGFKELQSYKGIVIEFFPNDISHFKFPLDSLFFKQMKSLTSEMLAGSFVQT